MQRQAQLDLDLQLCFPLYAAARALVQAYGPLLAPVGLTYPQYLTMLALWSADGPLTVGALGRRLRLDSATLTPLLKRLEAAGFVTRTRDVDDERRVLLAVTAAGEALQERVAHVPASIVERTGLTFEDGLALRRLLDGLLATLDGATEPDRETP